VFGSLFVLASLLLVVQVVPISELMVCDRYAYLPCVGLFLLAGALGLKIGSRNRLSKMATLACAGLVVVLLGVATFQRIPIWHDSLTLWNDVIEKHQDIWAAHLNRAMARSQVGDYGAAISDLDAALQLNPGSAQALNNRAGCHTYLKNWPAALRDFDRAIELKPDSDYFINRGILKQKMGDAAGALKDFDAVLEINPSNIRALSEKADTCRLSGSWSRAIEGYETILKLDPTHSYAAFWLGAVCFEVGQYEKAAVMLEKAISLNCGDPRAAYFLLGNAYQKLGRTDRAADAFRKSREMAGAKATAEQ
jgi:tetratricopeptide (TPR) repeat protein